MSQGRVLVKGGELSPADSGTTRGDAHLEFTAFGEGRPH